MTIVNGYSSNAQRIGARHTSLRLFELRPHLDAHTRSINPSPEYADDNYHTACSSLDSARARHGHCRIDC
eukprot:1186219-Prorocentrum_minimum.AAC.5